MIYKSDHRKKDMCLSFNLTTVDMIEFVNLPLIWRIIYEVAMETMHFHKAHTNYQPLDELTCKIDYIKTCNNDNIGMKSAFLYL